MKSTTITVTFCDGRIKVVSDGPIPYRDGCAALRVFEKAVMEAGVSRGDACIAFADAIDGIEK